MKINGQEIPKLSPKKAIFLREPVPVILTCQPILDFDDFEKVCPPPVAPEVLKPGGVRERNEKDASYIEAQEKYSEKRMAWIIIKSLEGNNITWEKVNVDDVDTYTNYKEELIESGFTLVEINYLLEVILEASQVETEDLKAMRESFLVDPVQNEEL